MTGTRSLAEQKFGNLSDVGVPRCFVHDRHSEPSQREEFGNSSDVGVPGFLVHDRHSEPSRREEFGCFE